MIYAVIPVLLALICLWLGRRMSTILLIMAYLSIEGFLKLMSNYNRIVHVGLDLIVVSLAGLLVLQAVVQRRAHLDELPYTKLILVYALWMVLQVLNPFAGSLVQSIGSFKIHLTMVPLYFISATLFREPRDVMKFLFGLTLISLIPYAMALVQYALGPASVLDLSPRFWANISYYHEWRPFGTSAVPGGAAIFAYLVAPLSMVLLISPGVRRTMKPLAAIAILLAAGTFVVSGGRQLFLGCIMIILVMAALAMSRRSGRVGVLAVAVILIGFGGYLGVQTFLRPMATEAIARDPRAPEIWRETDVTTRFGSLAEVSTYATARQNPVNIILRRATSYPFGAGLGRTGSSLGTFKDQILADPESARIQNEVGWTADNFFADMIVEGGLPALIMMMWILVGMLVMALRLARTADDPIVAATAAAITGFYLSILVMSYGSQPLLSNPITAYFWMLSGLCAAMQKMEFQRERESAQIEALDEATDQGFAPAGYR